jgi:hypothetical protein
LKQAPFIFLGSGHSLDMWPAIRVLAVAADDGILSESLTLSAVVAGVGVEVLVVLGSRPTIGSSFLNLQFLQLGLVLLAALVGSSVLVGESSVADIAVMLAGVDLLEAVVGVRREDVSHVDGLNRSC